MSASVIQRRCPFDDVEYFDVCEFTDKPGYHNDMIVHDTYLQRRQAEKKSAELNKNQKPYWI